MQNRPFRFGPTALTTSAADILNPPTITGGVGAGSATATYIILTHVRWVNKSGSAATFSAYLGATGATAAGTEVMGTAKSIAANDAYDWYGKMRLTTADFLVMLASANTSITVEGEGEIGVA